MAFFDENHVITGDALVIWDGITRPDQDPKTGQTKHNIKVAFPGNAPELAELEQLANKALAASEFKGQLPPGATWPIMDIDTTKQGLAHLTGYKTINAKTTLGAPQVYDLNGQELQPMQYSNMLYAGAKIRVLVHAYAFNNVQKGVAFGMDGIQIVDAQAPALEVGGGLSKSQVGAAFGGAPQQGAPAGPPAQPAPTPGPAAPPVQPPAAPSPGFPDGPSAPPAGPQMTDKAQGVPYESFIAQGWTDELLRQHGYMV